MKIASAQQQMASSHVSQQAHSIRESLRMWTGQQRPNFEALNQQRPQSRHELVNISDAGKAAQSADDINKEINDTVDKDPELNLIRDMLEFITGEKIKIFDSAELEAHFEQTRIQSSEIAATSETPPAAGYGLEYDYHESYTEIEQTSFSASGTVKTADGREISFNIELSMTRTYHEETNVSLRLGDAARKVDPLVLNFAGTAAQLTDRRFSFDLDSDGNSDNINFLKQGSGFLVFDRNEDGKVNDGRELFGPTTGDGFSELRQLDDDRNGWIDENDQQFNQLKVWSKDAAGTDQIQSLSDAGVGAISLDHINSPFLIKNNDNQLQGMIRSSGIFLQDTGETGTIQQIDLTA